MFFVSSKAQEAVTLTFTANTTQGGMYCPFDAVSVTNVTRGWTETLAYPDTVLVLNSTVGLGERFGATFRLGEAHPNPFIDETVISLETSVTGEVCIQVFRIDGTVITKSHNHLEAGTHIVKVSLHNPGMAFLVATSAQGRQVVRLLCTGNGGGDHIIVEPVSREFTPSGQFMRGDGMGEFQPGDMMRYTAILYDGANTIYSNTITQQQFESQTVTFHFDLTIPEVTTNQVIDITPTTATGVGNVTSTGGVSVIERGICWSTSHNPATNGNHASNGTGSGTYTVQMNGLTEGATYYVRAYTINMFGIAYGSEVSFTTIQIPNYTISVSANPTNGGTVSGGGSYQQGQSCTVIATAANGYSFNNWTENGSVVSTNPNYSFTVNNNRSLVANFSVQAPNTYTINASPNPSNGGVVTGGGTYQQGQSCTVSAVANTGYTFLRWTENGSQVSTNANYTFTVTGNRTLVAQFQLQSFSISATVTPSNSGTVAGGGYYNYGQICTLMATANTGYVFEKWTKNGTQVSTETTYSFTVTESASYVAHFQLQDYTINVSVNPSNGGSVTGGGSYNYGQSCTVCATAATGYTFTNWTENGTLVSTSVNYTFTVTSSRTLVANFTLQLQAPSGAINGLFSVSATQQVWFSQGNLQYIGSASTPYWKFADNQWDYLGDNGQGSTSLTVDRDLFGWGTSGYNHGAVCYQPWSTNSNTHNYWAYGNSSYNLYDQNGMADWGYNAISNGDNTENIGWRTLSWNEWDYVFNTRVTTSGIRYAKACVHNVNGVLLLPDDWDSSHYTLYYTNTNNAEFSVNNINETTWNTSLAPYGCIFIPAAGFRNATTAICNAGSKGSYWSASENSIDAAWGLSFTSNSITQQAASSRFSGYSVRLVQDKTNLPTITTSAITNITQTTATGGGNVINAGSSTVTARGVCWSTSHNPTISGNHTTNGTGTGNFTSNITGLTANMTYYVRAYATNSAGTAYGSEVSFTTSATSTYTISVSANPNNGGSVTGGGTYQQGQSCTVTATANSGYTFVNWTENGSVVSTNASYTFTVTGNRTLVANFSVQTPSTCTISVSSNPTNGGTILGGGLYYYGVLCSLIADAATGYIFTNWTENGNVVSTNPIYSFTVYGDRTLVANFEARPLWPNGVLPGVFSVGANQQVCFSQGNLQYIAKPLQYWRFAENQYDYVGSDNSNISQTYNGWIDLFGWGTSGYNHGAVCYQPWSTSQTYSDYYAYGNEEANLYDYTGKADWGYNYISNGGNQINQWRTLTTDEWQYVFNTRTTSSGLRYAKAKVNNVNGVILLPDNWSSSTYSLSNTNQGGASYSSNIISVSQWITLETAGAVFLPAAGDRQGTSVDNVGSAGCYWSASAGIGIAHGVSFHSLYLTPDTYEQRCEGHSVRLVQDVSYTINVSANPNNGGTVSGGGNYQQNQSCTVSATAATGYTFDSWTENGSVVSTNTNYTFSVTSSRTLVANFTLLPSPTGAINGLFSVSATKQVYFSKGNLQYQASTGTWRFAPSQKDYVGDGNEEISPNYSNWIDLFGWGTSGYSNHPPYMTSTDYTDYAPCDIAGGNYDWGVYNAIINGGNQAGLWRTLTYEEWWYVLKTRSASTVNGTTNARYAKALVEGVRGIILFPDNYTHPNGVVQPVEINDTGNMAGNGDWTWNHYSTNDFALMQAAGVVFLPAAGYRSGTTYHVYWYDSGFDFSECGFYWSASGLWNGGSATPNSNAWSVGIDSDGIEVTGKPRYMGQSVRLVQDY